jgi:drug/metabolite transporter (DMT)-like permease
MRKRLSISPGTPQASPLVIFLLTAFTLIAFAANSLLTRMALDGGFIDPLSFTTLRLSSGALALIPVGRLANARIAPQSAPTVTNGTWGSGLALFAYAAAFSLAYVTLTTGTGALILFGAVQITMLSAALKSGERLGPLQWLGLMAAVGGLFYLVLPGLAAPDPLGALLMALAGMAWGVYSLQGKGAVFPVAMTAGNFLRAAPLALAISLVALASAHWETAGILLALTSGVVTSGLGYILWYKALGGLTTTQASVVQLLVPVLAALGGVAFLSELLSLRLIIASGLILGGVALAILKRRPVTRYN